MKKSISIILVGIILLMAAICLAGEKPITAVADPWPPFVDPGNAKEGLSLEVVREALKTQGCQVEMKYMPWARAEKGVKEGKYDILPDTWFAKKREKYLYYSNPYAANKVKFIKRSGDPFEYNGLASLAGKKIGIIRGYGYGEKFMNAPQFQREEASNLVTNVKKLVKKRVDLALEDEIVARMLIAQEDKALLNQIDFTKNALSSNNLHVTTGKANPRGKHIIEMFNKGLAIIKSNGTYKAIMQSYGIE